MCPTTSLQSGKPNCTAFCASSVALLAGLGHNASCNGLQWLETAADCNKIPEDVAWLIFINWATIKFFRHFIVKKTSLPLPAERLSCLYIQWVAYKYECFWIKSLLAPKVLVYRGRKKGSKTVLRLNFVRKKLIPHNHNTPAFC